MTQVSAWFYPLFAMIIGGRLHGLGVIVHDLTHTNFRAKPPTFRVIEILCGYPIGTTIDAMAYHHLRHHKDTLLESDPYFNINKKCSDPMKMWLAFKKSPISFFWIARSFVGLFAYYLKPLRNFYARVFLQDVSGKDLSEHAEVLRCCQEDRFLALVHVGLIALAAQFPILIWCYYVPLWIEGVFCIYRLMLEHQYELVEDRSVYSLIECTFDHHMGLWGKIFFAPHKIGFHCMHHIHPGVGLHHLPRLRRWYVENSQAYQDRNAHMKDVILAQESPNPSVARAS